MWNKEDDKIHQEKKKVWNWCNNLVYKFSDTIFGTEHVNSGSIKKEEGPILRFDKSPSEYWLTDWLTEMRMNREKAVTTKRKCLFYLLSNQIRPSNLWLEFDNFSIGDLAHFHFGKQKATRTIIDENQVVTNMNYLINQHESKVIIIIIAIIIIFFRISDDEKHARSSRRNWNGEAT